MRNDEPGQAMPRRDGSLDGPSDRMSRTGLQGFVQFEECPNRAARHVAHDLVGDLRHAAGMEIRHLQSRFAQTLARKFKITQIKSHLVLDDVALRDHVHSIAGADLPWREHDPFQERRGRDRRLSSYEGGSEEERCDATYHGIPLSAAAQIVLNCSNGCLQVAQ